MGRTGQCSFSFKSNDSNQTNLQCLVDRIGPVHLNDIGTTLDQIEPLAPIVVPSDPFRGLLSTSTTKFFIVDQFMVLVLTILHSHVT